MACTTGTCTYLPYLPSLGGNAALLALFAALVVLGLLLGIRHNSSVFATTVISGLAFELIGYVCRILLRNDGANEDIYVLSETATIIGPSFIALAIYRLLPPVVAVYGAGFRVFRPAWHNGVFYLFTAVCVVLEILGEVLATKSRNAQVMYIGIRLLVAGLAIQVASLFVFAGLGLRFASAVNHARPTLDMTRIAVYNTRRFKAFILGLSLATMLLIVRTLYRTIAVSQDFSGTSPSTSNNETLFLVLDGVMVLVAAAALLLLFPGRMLGHTWSDKPVAHHATFTLKSQAHHRGHSASRPSPVHMPANAYSPSFGRMSIKSNNYPHGDVPHVPSKQHSPRQKPPTGLVDSDALW